jgi:2,3-bisphosphoglycerate-dependent phosphoglycerate mutase
MQFYFIRHGQSENNLLWYRTGSNQGRNEDPELTELGRRQAGALASYLSQTTDIAVARGSDSQNLASFGITHLYTSLMVRAVATGDIISRVLNLPLVAWEDLHEWGGIFLKDDQTGENVGLPGNDRAYFETFYPDLVLPESLNNGGWWDRPYETPEQTPARAQRFLSALIERHGETEDRVAVISHGGFYNTLMTALFNLPGRDGLWFALNNTAITRIDFSEQRILVVYLNRLGFLPKELVS